MGGNFLIVLIVALIALVAVVTARIMREWWTYRRQLRELDDLQMATARRIAELEAGKAAHPAEDAAYERQVRNILGDGVTVSYEHPDGMSSELFLDPRSIESIERFLKTIREEDALRGRQGEPAAPVR